MWFESAVAHHLQSLLARPDRLLPSHRAREIITERKLGPIVMVANRVRDARDVELITAGLGIAGQTLVVVPEDQVVLRADRDGVSPLDQSEVSYAVEAIGVFAATL